VQSRRFHSVASFIWMPCGVIGGRRSRISGAPRA
jgi:hypothetical protein